MSIYGIAADDWGSCTHLNIITELRMGIEEQFQLFEVFLVQLQSNET